MSVNSAVDRPSTATMVALAKRLAGHVAAVKIGKQLFTAEGPAAIRAMHDLGLRVFLDLKYHDIPNTVAGAVAAAKSLGVWLLKTRPHAGEPHEMFDTPFYGRFRRTVGWCVQHRWITIGATVALFAGCKKEAGHG